LLNCSSREQKSFIFDQSNEMELTNLLILLIALVIGFCVLMKNGYVKENLSGYGILSGLAANNKSLNCFKNIYDPPEYSGYCSVIGKVVV